MPSASVTTAMRVKPGALNSRRTACRRSCLRWSMFFRLQQALATTMPGRTRLIWLAFVDLGTGAVRFRSGLLRIRTARQLMGCHDSDSSPRAVHQGIERLIARHAIFDAARAQDRLTRIARFLEHTDRPGVVGEWQREEAQHVAGAEGVVGHEPQRFLRDAAAPERLADPVADLGRVPLDVRA